MGWLKRRFFLAADRLVARTSTRPPDFVIGGNKDPYLLRWYLVPWRIWHREARENPTPWRRVKGFFGLMLPSVYLHCFLRSDDDRALHDHPWFWCSILLHGGYTEHTIAAGGIHRRRRRFAPSIRFASPWRAHRIELFKTPFGPNPCWTLFITSPRFREWGFHCDETGWVPWRTFTAADDPGAIGRGCGEA